MHNAYDAADNNKEQTMISTTTTTTITPISFLGMEWMVAGAVYILLQQQRTQLVDVIYEIQTAFDDGLCTKSEMDQEIYESSHLLSKEATLFAQLLAKAQFNEEFL